MSPSYNVKNPAVKRIMQEIKEIQADTSGDLMAEALESDIFEWHFAIRGPRDTEFEGGIYHGRILLPADYPFKPPAFMMLTPSGRFETNMKICLSISTHHPEHWQPSWSVRTALTALIAFLPTPGAGALGSLDWTADERRGLAAKSRVEAPKFGTAERQAIIDGIHERMLAVERQRAQQHTTLAAAPVTPATNHGTAMAEPATAPSERQPTQTSSDVPAVPASAVEPAGQKPLTPRPSMAAGGAVIVSASSPSITPKVSVAFPTKPSSSTPLAAEAVATTSGTAATTTTVTPAAATAATVTPSATAPDTWGLTILAVALAVLILAILLRKAVALVGVLQHPQGHQEGGMHGSFASTAWHEKDL